MALVVLTALAMLLKLEVPLIGEIPLGLPSLVMPSLDLQRLPAVLSACDPARVTWRHRLSADGARCRQPDAQVNTTEPRTRGQGLGPIAAGLIGGIPGAGATMRTVVNVAAGWRAAYRA